MVISHCSPPCDAILVCLLLKRSTVTHYSLVAERMSRFLHELREVFGPWGPLSSENGQSLPYFCFSSLTFHLAPRGIILASHATVGLYICSTPRRSSWSRHHGM